MAVEKEEGVFDESEGHWSDEFDGIKSNADLLAYAKKFDGADKMAESAYNLEKKLGSSFRMPDDLKTLNEEQRAELLTKTLGLRDVPEKPEDYVIEVPKGTRNENFENAFRQVAFEHKMSKGDVKDITDFYHNALIAAQQGIDQKNEQDARAADTQFRIACGADYDKKMEGIKRLRMHVANELGLGYTNDKGELSSKLDDALDRKDASGNALGNQVAVLQFLDWTYENLLREGVSIPGAGAAGGKGGSIFDFEDMD